MNQIVEEQILQRFYESLTELIYDYLCFFREDKTTLPNIKVVEVIRRSTMDYMKHCMDMALHLDKTP